MRTLFKSLVTVAVLAAGGIAAVGAAESATQLFLGTWKLDLAKSQFGNGPTPKSITRAYSQAGDNYALKLTGTGSDGKPLLQESAFKFDGKDYLYTGRAEFDSVSIRHIDAHHYESTQKKTGKVVSVSAITISADGKMLTQVTRTFGDNGTTRVYTAVYFRQ